MHKAVKSKSLTKAQIKKKNKDSILKNTLSSSEILDKEFVENNITAYELLSYISRDRKGNAIANQFNFVGNQHMGVYSIYKIIKLTIDNNRTIHYKPQNKESLAKKYFNDIKTRKNYHSDKWVMKDLGYNRVLKFSDNSTIIIPIKDNFYYDLKRENKEKLFEYISIIFNINKKDSLSFLSFEGGTFVYNGFLSYLQKGGINPTLTKEEIAMKKVFEKHKDWIMKFIRFPI